MTEFIAYRSNARMLSLVLGAFLFVAIGVWMVGGFGDVPNSRRYPPVLTSIIGWICMAFFGFCGLSGVSSLFGERDVLRVGQAGVLWRPWSDSIIPWSEIVDVTTWEVRNQSGVVLHLRDPERFPGKQLFATLARANRVLTAGDISISLVATDRSTAEALSAIEHFRT